MPKSTSFERFEGGRAPFCAGADAGLDEDAGFALLSDASSAGSTCAADGEASDAAGGAAGSAGIG